MVQSFKFFLFINLLPIIAIAQPLTFVKDQTGGLIQQYHVLASNSKIKQGLYQEFASYNNTLLEEGNYKTNQKDSTWNYYDLKGNIQQQGSYTAGVRSGNWKTYAHNDSSAIIINEGNYVNGARRGEWVFRKNNGQLDYKYDYTQKKITDYGKNDELFTIIDTQDTITTAMDKPFIHIEGMDTLKQIIAKNFKMPWPLPNKNSGSVYRVIVSFNINEYGRLEDFKILKSTNNIYDSEVLRVVKLWEDGNWFPAFYKGHTVKTIQVIPLVFNLYYSPSVHNPGLDRFPKAMVKFE
jgi:TonB family protein